MDDRWKSARWAACITMAVLAIGCRAPEEVRVEEDLPIQVHTWNKVRVIPESINSNGFQLEGLPPGWTAKLMPWHIQGINPNILFAQLELVPGEPDPDEDAEATTWIECSFDYEEVWVVTPEGFIRLGGA